VHDPRHTRGALARTGLFAEESVSRTLPVEPVSDEGLDFAISFGDDVGERRLRRRQRHPCRAPTLRGVTCFTRDVGGEFFQLLRSVLGAAQRGGAGGGGGNEPGAGAVGSDVCGAGDAASGTGGAASGTGGPA